MHDIDPQTTDGKVHRHFAMSLDGCVASPEHAMDWMTGFSDRPSLSDEYIAGTVDDVIISRPGEETVVAESTSARYYGLDERLQTTGGRSHPC